MNIPLTSRVTVPEHVLTRGLDDELVILNMNTEKYLGLDDVGARMWMALTESESIHAAIEMLLEDYDVDEEQLRQDLVDLITEMLEQGLIELESG